MTDLTPDEKTVLMIAAEGQSMMAIARWEKPIESLVAKGLMQRGDQFNNWITPKGRAAINEPDTEEDEAYRQILTKGAQVRDARQQAQASVEQAAMHLSLAAKASAVATGDTLENAARAWSSVVLERALELLR